MRRITISDRSWPVAASGRWLADSVWNRVFDLADEAVAAKNLEGIAAVLHCAGPFCATSRPMLAECLRAGTHYLG
jgi:short subunit dehydrogenase-like uncharacterized protein